MYIKEKDTRETRLVFDARIARKLLKMKNNIIDIKTNRENMDKSIIVFENTKEFRYAYKKVKKDIKEFDENKTVEEIKSNYEQSEVNLD